MPVLPEFQLDQGLSPKGTFLPLGKKGRQRVVAEKGRQVEFPDDDFDLLRRVAVSRKGLR
jgi:hypothetical protein